MHRFTTSENIEIRVPRDFQSCSPQITRQSALEYHSQSMEKENKITTRSDRSSYPLDKIRHPLPFFSIKFEFLTKPARPDRVTLLTLACFIFYAAWPLLSSLPCPRFPQRPCCPSSWFPPSFFRPLLSHHLTRETFPDHRIKTVLCHHALNFTCSVSS